MTDAEATTVATQGHEPRWPALARLRPPTSKVAAFRALRATLVIPGLFALTSHILQNSQISLYATFGGFATLVLASFAGDRSQKLAAHVCLGIVGSLLIPLATVASGSTPAAALVALPVVFCVIFVGATGWNAANGSAAALLAYILPATSAGTVDMLPSRLAGWWLATAAGTLAVLLLSPRSANPLRGSARVAAGVLASQLDAMLHGVVQPDRAARIHAVRHDLTTAFIAAPYRPTGLAIADQALARAVEALRWCASLVSDLITEEIDLSAASSSVTQSARQCFEASSRVLREVSEGLGGSSGVPSLAQLDAAPRSRSEELKGVQPATIHEVVHVAFYANVLAEGVRAVAANALVASGASQPDSAKEPRTWRRGVAARAQARLSAAAHDLRGQLSVRSVWVRNGARGAVAIAAAVAIADLTNVQHGFWVVLGTLGVLRTNAASTGASAWQALLGTVAGVLIGAGIVLGIGVGSAALWAAFVLAVLLAAYAPGVLPFPAGQAAFSVMLLVLFNLIAPVGWKVGVVRLEDVGIGIGVSALVGLLFWPRGAVAAVADDLADTLHRDGIYLVQATSWALGTRSAPPDGAAVVRASERLDDATRSLLTEHSAKPTPKEQLWHLVGGAMRLRLTGASLAAASTGPVAADRPLFDLLHESVQVAARCDELAAGLGRVEETVVRELAGVMPSFGGPDTAAAPRLVWIREHLEHARATVLSMSQPAEVLAQVRRTPWWR